MSRLLESDFDVTSIAPATAPVRRTVQPRCSCGEPLYDSGRGTKRTMCWDCADKVLKERRKNRKRGPA